MTQPATKFEVSVDDVATLTMQRPERRNALDAEMKQGLADAIAEVQGSAAIRSLIVTGSGGTFCAGGDLRSMLDTTLTAADRRDRLIDLHHRVIVPLLRLDRPVIAAVDGAAYGGGFSLALAADFIVASTEARFCMSFLRIGLVPDCASWWTLPRFVGQQRARELMLSAREVAADEASRIGIAMEVHAASRLLPRAYALAASFMNASPAAMAAIKHGLDRAAGAHLDEVLAFEVEAQAEAFAGEPHRLAVRRFVEQRTAAFEWPANREYDA